MTGPIRKALRSLTVLVGVLIILIGTLTAGVVWGSATWMPKLGLDLRGGTEILLKAETDNGKAPSSEQMSQAVSIIRQRVDASGVSEAQINTQGPRNIDISLPGNPSQETINLVKASARLEFREVWATNDTGTDSTTGVPNLPKLTGLSEKKTALRSELASEVTSVYSQYSCRVQDTSSSSKTSASKQSAQKSSGKSSAKASASASASASVSPSPSSKVKTKPSNPIPENLSVSGLSRSDLPLVTCDQDGNAKYLLAPVVRQGSKVGAKALDGTALSNASAGLQSTSTGATTNNWVVNMNFTSVGSKLFGQVTGDLAGNSAPQNRFAIVLDGRVVSAPSVSSAITGGKADIEGSFTQKEAQTLADQLKYGALPINFTVQSQEKISPTLGASQLTGGLIAGLIGLLLVVAFSVLQYRALGGVTILSLAIAAVTTFFLISVMSWTAGYRLSLAGIAGLIVSIGITADSFIVYFERIRDELRDGHTLITAVEFGWRRALRTILASDGINLLAAITLYILTVGNVRGFAFTLGLTTLVDVFVVMFFTHPTMQLLANTRFFGEGHHFSGLSPKLLGANGHHPVIRPGAASSLTIAERKALEQAKPPAESSPHAPDPDASADDRADDDRDDTQKGQH